MAELNAFLDNYAKTLAPYDAEARVRIRELRPIGPLEVNGELVASLFLLGYTWNVSGTPSRHGTQRILILPASDRCGCAGSLILGRTYDPQTLSVKRIPRGFEVHGQGTPLAALRRKNSGDWEIRPTPGVTWQALDGVTGKGLTPP